jgi:hypothetical protein
VNVAKTATSLGDAHRVAGRLEAAVEAWRQALVVLTELGSLAWQASIRASLAEAFDALGTADEAAWQRAEQALLEREIRRRGRESGS